MRTKLETIKWALAHLDESVYFEGKRYQIVGVRLTENERLALCLVKRGWVKLGLHDCILSDLVKGDKNQFNYMSIDSIENQWIEQKLKQ